MHDFSSSWLCIKALRGFALKTAVDQQDARVNTVGSRTGEDDGAG